MVSTSMAVERDATMLVPDHPERAAMTEAAEEEEEGRSVGIEAEEGAEDLEEVTEEEEEEGDHSLTEVVEVLEVRLPSYSRRC
jgi:hypothetical protein